jgi:prephenate dehydratase
VIRVAYQGAPGAFSETAIAQLWGDDAERVPCPEFGDVARAVARGDADAGVLPVENLIIGPIASSLAAMAAEPALRVTADTVVAIRPLLLALSGVAWPHLRRVTSHPAALAQCSAFLARHPQLHVEHAWDTAGAARDLAASGDRTLAVIAGDVAAARYGLSVVRDGIADRADNATRFVAIALHHR